MGNTDRGKLSIKRVAGIAHTQLKADWSVGNPGQQRCIFLTQRCIFFKAEMYFF